MARKTKVEMETEARAAHTADMVSEFMLALGTAQSDEGVRAQIVELFFSSDATFAPSIKLGEAVHAQRRKLDAVTQQLADALRQVESARRERDGITREFDIYRRGVRDASGLGDQNDRAHRFGGGWRP
jgi:hypothetical protein